MALDRKKVCNRVTKMVAKILGKDLVEITLDADLIFDLGADSLDLVDLITALQGEYDIDLPLFSPAKMSPNGENTVNAIVDKICEEKIAA